MKKRQLKEFERLLNNCDFYFDVHNVVKYINEVGALRGFSYALKEDWIDEVPLDLSSRYNYHISLAYDYMNRNDDYLKFVSNFWNNKNE